MVEGDLKSLTTQFLKGAWLLMDTVGLPLEPPLAFLKFSSALSVALLIHSGRQLGCNVTFHS